MPLNTSIPLQVQMPQFADPVDPATQQYNALRAQALQQEMMRNQLIMQNTMEDRRREEANRRLAAATAAAEKRRKEELMGIYSQFGVTPAAIGQRGASYSGTGVSTNPFEPVRNQLVQKGFLPQAADIAELENKTLTGAKAKAELPGIEAESRKKGTDADVAEYDAAVSRLVPLVRSVKNGQDAANFTNAMYDDPTLGPKLEKIIPRAQAVARAPAEYDANPLAWTQSHMLTGKELSDALSAAQKPIEMDLGGKRVLVDPVTLKPRAEFEKTLTPDEAAKSGKSESARASLEDTLGTMLSEYEKLAEGGDMPSETNTYAGNVAARFKSSELGRFVGADAKAQTSFQRLDGLRRDLLLAIKNATGMTAQEMNSNEELKQMMAALTAAGNNMEAVRLRLGDISKRYGLGKSYAPAEKRAPAEESRSGGKTAKLSDIEHTAKVNNLSVEEVKKRVRAMGMAIEGE